MAKNLLRTTQARLLPLGRQFKGTIKGFVFLSYLELQRGQSYFQNQNRDIIPYQRCLAHDPLTPEKDNWGKPSALYQADL